LENLTALAVAAAKAILDCRVDSGVGIKADGSPVTPADEAAETIVREPLARLAPCLPVVSEEQAKQRRPAAGANYFLVDPLIHSTACANSLPAATSTPSISA